MTLEIRALRADDRDAWEPLWQGYMRFYESGLTDEVTDATWARFAEPDEPMGAIGAFIDGNLVGICHHVFHRSTWSASTYCYLEDLFTTPTSRGEGVGRALIEATADLARAAGASKLYWQTHQTNTTARALYDQMAKHDGFLVYERTLT